MEQWWRPDLLAARRDRLAARGRILSASRNFFAERGFVEVDTPALQVSPGLEPHLRAFGTLLHDPRDNTLHPRYLHTSPEFAMKKLLAGGMTRIWQLAHAFRDGERGATHHPEFAMLEWYHADASYRDLMDDCEALLRRVQAAGDPLHPSSSWPGVSRPSTPLPSVPPVAMEAGPPPSSSSSRDFVDGRDTPGHDAAEERRSAGLTWHGRSADARLPFQRLSVAEAFAHYAGIDILATAPDPARPDLALLTEAAARAGIARHPGDDWESLYFRVFLDRVEPRLGIGAPTILYDYPISMAALSRAKPDDPRLAERFELYVCGLELANAFSELTDPAEQRARFQADQAKKQALYGTTYPIDEDFLAALEHGLPDCAGIALGFDRLVMLATGADHIEDVLWMPVS